MLRSKVRGEPSARREFQQLDRVEVLHAAADALGRVEQHVRIGSLLDRQGINVISFSPSQL